MTAAATELSTEIIPFTAGDGMALNMHRVRGKKDPWRGPVILVHGAGVRANIFRAPEHETVVDALVAAGWDVWLENWRASIDVEKNLWNLDQAAVYDHPRAIDTIVEATGAASVKAVIHCQGSSSFALSSVAGLLPKVDTIVSNAMALHPIVPRWSRVKLDYVVPAVSEEMGWVDPHWGASRPDGFLARAMVELVRVTHRECDNTVCKMVSFTYGAGRPGLWRHENFSAQTHAWLTDEFGPVPLTFFKQIAKSARVGRLLPTGTVPGMPLDPLSGPPAKHARFHLMAGTHNRCFLPESQTRTYEYLESHDPGRHSIEYLKGYGHLDVFMGKYAARDVFPQILEQLAT